MKEGYSIPIPLKDAVKNYTDQELIETICTYLAKLKKSKYDVNEAALVLLDSVQTEWVVRHGKTPVPKIVAEDIFVFEGDIHDPFIY